MHAGSVWDAGSRLHKMCADENAGCFIGRRSLTDFFSSSFLRPHKYLKDEHIHTDHHTKMASNAQQIGVL